MAAASSAGGGCAPGRWRLCCTHAVTPRVPLCRCPTRFPPHPPSLAEDVHSPGVAHHLRPERSFMQGKGAVGGCSFGFGASLEFVFGVGYFLFSPPPFCFVVGRKCGAGVVPSRGEGSPATAARPSRLGRRGGGGGGTAPRAPGGLSRRAGRGVEGGDPDPSPAPGVAALQHARARRGGRRRCRGAGRAPSPRGSAAPRPSPAGGGNGGWAGAVAALRGGAAGRAPGLRAALPARRRRPGGLSQEKRSGLGSFELFFRCSRRLPPRLALGSFRYCPSRGLRGGGGRGDGRPGALGWSGERG